MIHAPSAGLVILAVAVALHAASRPHRVPPPIDPPPGLPAPATDADYYDPAARSKVELGRLLFFDKILSGNRNIACATCHHPALATGDGIALGLGEGPTGLGPDRRGGTDRSRAVHGRIPRNSPALFNVGATEFTRLFHDGRVEVDTAGYYEGGFITPAKWKLHTGLDNVLAAQAMFPVTSPEEMAGQKGENEIADAVSLNNVAGPGGAWELLGARLAAVPEYVDRFRSAYPDEVRSAADVTYVLAANAIAAFEAEAFRADDSPFDRYLRGDRGALDAPAQRGMALFYGSAGCSGCHEGTFQTDHEFHAIAMPQIGPGKGDGNDGAYWSESGHQAFLEDLGRGRVTVDGDDNFRFRTPSLRNVTETGPWGHAGAFDTLEEAVRHHLNPEASLHSYRLAPSALPDLPRVVELTAAGSTLSQEWLADSRRRGFLLRDGWVQSQAHLRARIADANELRPANLTEPQVRDLLAFLEALTDPSFSDLVRLEPDRVPSGLPVEN